MRYGIVIEWAGANYSAYAPDLPGCIATGKTIDDTERAIREAIAFHVQGMRKDGDDLPEPRHGQPRDGATLPH